MNNLPLYVLVVFITSVTPGAGVLYTVSSGFRGGMKTMIFAPLGNLTGVTTISAISATGLGAMIAASPSVYAALQLVGAGVLFWLGWKNFSAPAMDLSRVGAAAAGERGNGRDIFLGAALLQATNPMLIVFLLSLFPQFIDPEGSYPVQAALLIAIFAGVCFCVHIGYSFLAAYGSRYLSGPRFSWWLNRVSAVLFWLLGLSVVWKALAG
jgi:homoserine/homoserine lactone efflux protein